MTVVTAHPVGADPIGVTVNSFTSLSLTPPLVLFCLGKGGRALAQLRRAEAFAINVLADDQRDLASRFAGDPEAWRGLATTTWRTGAPIIEGSVAMLDCIRHAEHDGGDHRILVGRVVAVGIGSDARPLVYYRGGFTRLAEDI